MISNHLVWVIFHIAVVSGLILLFFCVLCMGLYDIKQAKQQAKLRRSASKRRLLRFSKLGEEFLKSREKLSITLIIPAYNEELVVKRCLESVAYLDYPNLQIVVVNDASKDSTAKIAKTFIKEHPKLKIRLVNLRRNRGKGGAMNYVLKHYCGTELFMVLDADCTIKSDALMRAVEYFDDPQLVGLATNVRIAEDPTILSYLQKIEYVVGYRHKKFASYINSEFIIGGQGATYRTDVVKRLGGFNEKMMTEDIELSLKVSKLGNKTHRLAYASDVITYTEAVPNLNGLFKQRYRWKFGALQALAAHREMILSRSRQHSLLLTWFRIPQALVGEILLFAEPFLLGIFIFIALITHSLFVFFGSWFTLTVYSLFIILLDEHSTRHERLKMAIVMPFMFPFFYTITILNVVAAFKCVINWRKLVGRELVSGSWVSPNRVGKLSLS